VPRSYTTQTVTRRLASPHLDFREPTARQKEGENLDANSSHLRGTEVEIQYGALPHDCVERSFDGRLGTPFAERGDACAVRRPVEVKRVVRIDQPHANWSAVPFGADGFCCAYKAFSENSDLVSASPLAPLTCQVRRLRPPHRLGPRGAVPSTASRPRHSELSRTGATSWRTATVGWGSSSGRAVFSHHPYATRPEGEIGTLTALTADAITAHLAMLRETSRLLLVVVGDVDASHVIDLARAAFASVPRGNYVETPIPALHFDAPRAIGDAHPLATNYVAAFFAGPSPADPDYVPVRVMIAVLSHRVWDEVRAKRNLSYAPWAVFRWYYAAPYGGFYVSSVDPSAAMQVMMDEARRVQTDLVPPDELLGAPMAFWIERRHRPRPASSALPRASSCRVLQPRPPSHVARGRCADHARH